MYRGSTSKAEVQELAGTVAFLKAEILTDAGRHGSEASVVDKHMARLNEWYCSLPDEVRLAGVLSEGDSLFGTGRRGLLFVHILFLGAIILLHRRLFAFMATAQLQGLSSHGSSESLMVYPPVTAARQIAQIFRTVDNEKDIFRRCWLCM